MRAQHQTARSTRRYAAFLVALLIFLHNSDKPTLIISAAVYTIGGVELGQISTLVTVERTVYHMAFDLREPGHLLHSDGYSLKTYDGTVSRPLAGLATNFGYREGVSTAAVFTAVTGFVQLNASTVVMVDHHNVCLRLLDRNSLQTQRFVGQCGIGGFVNGPSATFNFPWTVVRNEYNPLQLLVADLTNNAIRAVDIITRDVSTFLSTGLNAPSTITFNTEMGTMFITSYHYISEYNFQTQTHNILTGTTTPGHADGPTGDARFSYPKGMSFFSNETLLVADMGTSRLRLINTATQTVQTVCTGDAATIDGLPDTCSTKTPHSILLSEETIFVGEDDAIRTSSCVGCVASDAEWGSCYRKAGACLQSRGWPGGLYTRSCPHSCTESSFEPTRLMCPHTVLRTVPDLPRIQLCAPLCLSTDFCTGFMYDPAASACRLVDGFRQRGDCSATGSVNWVKK